MFRLFSKRYKEEEREFTNGNAFVVSCANKHYGNTTKVDCVIKSEKSERNWILKTKRKEY